MDEKRYIGKHKVIVDKRQKLSITGLIDVMSFDDETIVTETEMGILIIRGNNLHVNALNLEKGELEIDGSVDHLNYEDENPLKGKNLFGKIFK